MNSKIIVLLFTFAVVTGCATSGTPKRPDYTGEDSVADVKASMIIGKWRTRILNPVKGEDTASNAIVHYHEDGRVIMDTDVDTGGMGVLQMEVSGTWAVNGEAIEQVATDVREKSGSALGTLVKMFSGRMLKNANTVLDVYEASTNRLVVVSDNGQAQEMTRIE